MHLLPTHDEVVRVLRDTGALRDGHFVYPNGLHSNEYLQVPLAMRYYQHAKTLSVGLSRLLRANSEIRADTLATARLRDYFDDPDTAEPLRWLETCDEQVKDCMAVLESMMDPKLDELMAAAMEEHQRGETVPLGSIR